jgi:hypothetical protein
MHKTRQIRPIAGLAGGWILTTRIVRCVLLAPINLPRPRNLPRRRIPSRAEGRQKPKAPPDDTPFGWAGPYLALWTPLMSSPKRAANVGSGRGIEVGGAARGGCGLGLAVPNLDGRRTYPRRGAAHFRPRYSTTRLCRKTGDATGVRPRAQGNGEVPLHSLVTPLRHLRKALNDEFRETTYPITYQDYISFVPMASKPPLNPHLYEPPETPKSPLNPSSDMAVSSQGKRTLKVEDAMPAVDACVTVVRNRADGGRYLDRPVQGLHPQSFRSQSKGSVHERKTWNNALHAGVADSVDG